MQLIFIQIVVVIFVLFAISRAYLRYREKKLTSFGFLFWNLIWILGALAFIFPQLTTDVARMLGIGRGSDAVLYASVVVLFYLLFRVYIKIEDTQKDITKIIREIALQNIKRPRKKSHKG